MLLVKLKDGTHYAVAFQVSYPEKTCGSCKNLGFNFQQPGVLPNER